jgi:hypothetical protein
MVRPNPSIHTQAASPKPPTPHTHLECLAVQQHKPAPGVALSVPQGRDHQLAAAQAVRGVQVGQPGLGLQARGRGSEGGAGRMAGIGGHGEAVGARWQWAC